LFCIGQQFTTGEHADERNFGEGTSCTSDPPTTTGEQEPFHQLVYHTVAKEVQHGQVKIKSQRKEPNISVF